jgi:hypothetical protein
MVKGMNSVKANSFGYANTEPSMNDKFKACVETMGSPSLVDDDIVRPCMKIQELSRNEIVAQKCVVTDCNVGDYAVHNHRPAFGGNRCHLRNFCDIPANDSLIKPIGFIVQSRTKGDF